MQDGCFPYNSLGGACAPGPSGPGRRRCRLGLQVVTTASICAKAGAMCCCDSRAHARKGKKMGREGRVAGSTGAMAGSIGSRAKSPCLSVRGHP